jgi:hypothetical protein
MLAELEEQNQSLRESNGTYQSELAKLRQEDEQRSKELSSLRNRMNLSQQNWLKEREDLITREALAREEFEAAKQAMQDWEVLAMEERSIRESQGDRMALLEEQLSNMKEAYEKAASERETQALSVDGLQRALQDIQDGQCDCYVAVQIPADSIFPSPEERATRACRDLKHTGRRLKETASGGRKESLRGGVGSSSEPEGTREGTSFREGGKGEKPIDWETAARSSNPE